MRTVETASPGELDNGSGSRLARGLGWFSLALGAAQVAAPDALNRLVGADTSDRNRAILVGACGLREMAAGIGLLGSAGSQRGWLRARVCGDVLDLALLGAILLAKPAGTPLPRGPLAALAAVGGVMALDLIGLSRRAEQT
jgi:hypothetical protein